MTARELEVWLGLVGPHAVAVALCAARLLPVVLLCPVLGGQATPVPVKLGVVLGLAVPVHVAGGIQAPALDSAWALAALTVRELCFGTAIGLVAALPFDAARIGGRLIDLFRGTSAEAALPLAGTREAATGDGLYQLLVAQVAAAGALPAVISSLWRSFGLVRPGAFAATAEVGLQIAACTGTALATGLAVGAPVAAASLCVDLALGLAARAAPQVGLQELGAPVRILAGGALVWLGIGVISDRLLAGVSASEAALRALAEAAR